VLDSASFSATVDWVRERSAGAELF